MADAPNRILVINPAATTTHVAVFEGETTVVDAELQHTPEELAAYDRVWDQYLLRKDRVTGFLAEAEVPLTSLSAVAGRG